MERGDGIFYTSWGNQEMVRRSKERKRVPLSLFKKWGGKR